MKADETRTPLPTRPKHEIDHALPTVIHHPEEDLPLLARWLRRVMENPTQFWGLIAGTAVVVLVLSLLGSGLTIGKVASDEAWTKLETAKTPGERVELAKEFPDTPAERWALLQAASEYYSQGFTLLPNDLEAARPNLKKALDLFQKVAEQAPADSAQARAAALGAARTLEARNELEKAGVQYDKIAQNKAWAGTEEAREAAKLARRLKSPEAATFYKDLYAFKAPEATLAPGGIGSLPFTLPTDHPPLNGPTAPTSTSPFVLPMPRTTGAGATEPDPLAVPPPPPTPANAAKDPGSKPLDLAFPLKTDAPAPKTQPKGELPDDVFNGKPSGSK